MPTSRFGPLSASAQDVIELPQGLIGLPALTQFVVHQADPGSVFQGWQAVESPETAFVILDIAAVVPDYDLRGLEAEWSDLGADDPGLRRVGVIVSAPEPTLASVTLNLAAPIFVNTATRRARQVVVPDGRYSAAVRLDEVLASRRTVELAA